MLNTQGWSRDYFAEYWPKVWFPYLIPPLFHGRTFKVAEHSVIEIEENFSISTLFVRCHCSLNRRSSHHEAWILVPKQTHLKSPFTLPRLITLKRHIKKHLFKCETSWFSFLCHFHVFSFGREKIMESKRGCAAYTQRWRRSSMLFWENVWIFPAYGMRVV